MMGSPKIIKGRKTIAAKTIAVGAITAAAARRAMVVAMLAVFIFAFNASISPDAEATVHYTLTVYSDSQGVSSVGGCGGGNLCAAINSHDSKQYDSGANVIITAAPSADYYVSAWSGGGCSGTGGSCTVHMTADTTVHVTYTANPILTATASANGSISGDFAVAASHSGTHTYSYNATASLTANPLAGYTVSWSGCTTVVGNLCTVTMTGNMSVTATFVSNAKTLTISKTETGGATGTVTSLDGFINCGAACSHAYPVTDPVTSVTLHATAAGFSGWSGGGCSGTADCTITMSANTTVSATYGNPTLTVNQCNNGHVTVSSVGDCWLPTCTYDAIAQGTGVTLTASAVVGFIPCWESALDCASATPLCNGSLCSGNGTTCNFTLNSATTVNVAYLRPVLIVINGLHGSVSGNGISSSGGQISSVSLLTGTAVTLTAVADPTYLISSWSGGGCSGNGATCSFTITGNTTVSVDFAGGNLLTVTKAGTGTGAVTSNPAGIDCGATCNASFPLGQSVTLTAAASPGSVFFGWGGNCAASGTATTCTITMSAAKNVTATFKLPTAYTMDQNDCVKPPFLGQSPLPNLLLMFDNSLSMYDQQYYASVDSGVDSTYDDTRTYTGYFVNTTYYQGLNATNLAGDGAGSYFSVYPGVFSADYPSGAVYPNMSCNFYTPYLCVQINALVTPHTVTNFVASGNFLNWLTTSKMDVQKKILTGGKYDSATGRLIGETRGWNGMRFVRQVRNTYATALNQSIVPWYTFSVRGPLSATSTVSPGGATRIDISEGYYNYALCQTVIADWTAGNSMGQTRQDLDACLTPAGVETAVQSAKNGAFNQSVQSCWEVGQGRAIPNGHDTSIGNQCQSAYDAGVDPSTIKPADLSYVCSSIGGARTTPNILASSFVGACAVHAGSTWTLNVHGACIMPELQDYCAMFIAPPVTDPTGFSGFVGGATNTWGIPAMFTDAGLLAQGGDPIGVLQANVEFTADSKCASYSSPASPCGLVHQFDKYIRFGVMTFNDYGAWSECAANPALSTSCADEKDGGYIAKYIKSVASGGSSSNYDCKDGAAGPYYTYDSLTADNTGLSDAINAIQARTWTPWAEAYYNALGYYTHDANTSGTPPVKLNASDYTFSCANPHPTGPGSSDTSTNADGTSNRPTLSCRQNNVLIISDGMSTADLNASVSHLAATYNDGDTRVNSAAVACLDYSGSYNLDDLSWLAYNKNIFDFTAKGSTTTASQYITTYAVYTGTSTGLTDECTAEGLMRATASNGGTSLYTASNPADLETALTDAFLSISKRAAAGTAASVLGERGQLGMNVLQAVFYPSKLFATGETLSWIGYLNNIWYYSNRTTGVSHVSQLREDTVEDDTLNLKTDYIMEFAFINDELKIQRWQDTDGTGAKSIAITPDITLDDFKPVWEAGKMLSDRATERTIYVNDNAANFPKVAGGGLTAFTDAAKASFKAFLGDLNGDLVVDAGDDASATTLINYIRGADQTGYRSRTVNGKVWKLGDIVYSTPDVVEYDNYSVVYVGANDGMLHAFKVGKLTSTGLSDPDKTKLVNTAGVDDGIPAGEEMWAFIPKNALPYLRYLADPSYCHVYIVDLRSYVSPLAYKGRKLLIGGMRLGGRCGGSSTFVPKTDVCPEASLNDTGTDGYNTSSGNDCVGLSSYFAMDVTDPTAPKLLWEFSHPNLKFSYSGPAVINRNNTTYVMFLSGPDAYDGTVTAAQNLHAFVLKLKQADLTIDTVTIKDFGAASFARSFGGRLFTDGLDMDEDGNTDFVFFGYSKYGGTSGGEDVWDGGIVKVYTGDPDPANWDYDGSFVTFDIDSDGTNEGYPFTGKVVYEKCFSDSRYHLYFGSGLYFKANQTYSSSKPDIIAGIPFKCDAGNHCATATIALDNDSTDPVKVCSNLSAAISGGGDLWSKAGWVQKLALSSGVYLKERAISDPTTTRYNFAMFATTAPSGDMCAFAGQSYIWAVNCATGSAVSDTTCSGAKVTAVQGQLLMQLSTAAIVQKNVSEFFTGLPGTQKFDSGAGITPESAPPFISLAPKKTRLLHWLER